MVRTLLAFAALGRTVAEVPTCQQDETTLLQGSIKHHVNALQHPSLDSDPDEVVAWVAQYPNVATTWMESNPEDTKQWAQQNLCAAEEIVQDNPEMEWLLFGHRPPKFPRESLTKLPQTKCLDGSQAGYYSDIKDSDIWVIFMQGGGGCWDAVECEERLSMMLGNSTKWPSADNCEREFSRSGATIADCDKNPDFCQANHIFIPYCSGDTHQGTRNETHEGFYFSGHLNFQAIIEHLLATTSLGSASRVLLTGASAGGIGVLANADTLSDMLPDDVTVKAAPIAGWFMPDSTEDHPNDSWAPVSFYEDYSKNISTDPNISTMIWTAQQDWTHPHTGNCSEGEKCQNMPILADYVETPMLISENMWDKFHLKKTYIIPVDPETWNASTMEWVGYYARAMQASTGKIGGKSGNGLFLPATISHGGDVGSAPSISSSAVVKGKTYFQVLADWFYDYNTFDHVVTDACNSTQSCLDRLEEQVGPIW